MTKKDIVFLSHSSKDKKQLVPFRAALQEKTNKTIEFFLSSDGQSIPVGHNWVASIEHSLDEAKLAFLLLTPNSLGSTWVAFEAGFMHSKKIRVIPVALPGVDLGQVAPPISLLQGFNMHSHEAMNNFFEILNQEFQHGHKPTFTEEDFRKIFGADSELGSGFFGEYSGLVGGISFSGTTKAENLIPTLEVELGKLDIRLTKADGMEVSMATCPGLKVTTRDDGKSPNHTVTIHREMFSLLLGTVCSVIAKVCPPPYAAEMNFIPGVEECGSEVHVSARAYGTDFVVQPYGKLQFRKINLDGVRNPLGLHSLEPFKADEIRELVTSCFDSGMLELKPVKQIDPMIAGLASIANRMQRRYY
jgi:hypothetical protein